MGDLKERPARELLGHMIYNAEAELRHAKSNLNTAITQVESLRVEIAGLEQRLVDYRVAREELS